MLGDAILRLVVIVTLDVQNKPTMKNTPVHP
jgi:hypothetical protein